MTALTNDKAPVRFGRQGQSSPVPFPVAASTLIYEGAGCVNSAGVAVNAFAGTGLQTLGVARRRFDNSTGGAGAIVGEFDTGEFLFNNSSGGDLLANVDVGNPCYWVDDQTVAKTSATSTRSIAGTVVQINPTGYPTSTVVVKVGF